MIQTLEIFLFFCLTLLKFYLKLYYKERKMEDVTIEKIKGTYLASKEKLPYYNILSIDDNKKIAKIIIPFKLGRFVPIDLSVIEIPLEDLKHLFDLYKSIDLNMARDKENE